MGRSCPAILVRFRCPREKGNVAEVFALHMRGRCCAYWILLAASSSHRRDKERLPTGELCLFIAFHFNLGFGSSFGRAHPSSVYLKRLKESGLTDNVVRSRNRSADIKQ